MLEAVYFIDVVSHNEMSQHLWTNSAYIYRIKDNWSDLLEKNLIKGDPFSEKGEEATHYKLRKAHISTFTELKDGSLQGLLGGYASDGSSTDAVLQSQYMYRGVSVLEELMSPQFWNLIGQALEVVEQLNSNRYHISGKPYFTGFPEIFLFYWLQIGYTCHLATIRNCCSVHHIFKLGSYFCLLIRIQMTVSI